MTGSAKQSISPRKSGLLRRFAPRNDGGVTVKFSFVIAREGGQSSIPEAVIMESKDRGVLDTRLRGV
jgi:hypothetical protein